MRRPVRGTPLVVVASVVALALVGIFVRSFSTAESGGRASAVLEIVTFVLGVWVPLFALIYACVRSRVAVVALAFCVGLSVNLVFLTHAIPAAAVTDNSNVFTFENSTSFANPTNNMRQNYTPSSGTATTCPNSGYDVTCTFASDTFTAGQTMNAGTAQADLYIANNPAPPAPSLRGIGSGQQANSGDLIITTAAGMQVGDLLLTTVVQKDNVVSTMPAGWTQLSAGNGTATFRTAIWWKRAQVGEAQSVLTHTGGNCVAGFMTAWADVDPTTPFDVANSWTYETATDQDVGAAGISTVTVNTLPVMVAGIGDNPTALTAPAGWQQAQSIVSSQGTDCGMWVGNKTTLSGAAGSQPAVTLTTTGAANFESYGAQIALRPIQAGTTCTVTVTLKKQRPIWLRDYTTNAVNNSLSITVTKPALAQPGDVLVLSIAYSSGGSSAAPTGFTIFSFINGIVSFYHVVGASDPGPWTWTNNTSQSGIVAWLGAYAEVDNTTPKDPLVRTASTTATTTHTTSIFAPMSTVNANEMVLVAWTVWANATWTPPVGMAEAIDMKNPSNVIALGVDHAIQAQAGASGLKTAISSAAGNGVNMIFALNPASAATTLGSTTVQVTGGPALFSPQFATSAATFADGDRLVLDVTVPDDPANCGVAVTYDSTAAESKLTLATAVPDGVAGWLLLAPALPLAIRRWRGSRP